MNIDRQEEVVILFELNNHGGRMSKARAIATVIASGFLKPLPGDTVIRQSRETAIENDLAWARENLKEKRQLTMPERGIWQITQAGRDRLFRIAKVAHERKAKAESFARYSQSFLDALEALGKHLSEQKQCDPTKAP